MANMNTQDEEPLYRRRMRAVSELERKLEEQFGARFQWHDDDKYQIAVYVPPEDVLGFAKYIGYIQYVPPPEYAVYVPASTEYELEMEHGI